MRAVVQRVRRASVTVLQEIVGEIGAGLCVFLGVAAEDASEDLRYVADKVVNLRIFADDNGKMNRSVLDTAGGVLVISQFTLLADVRKGRRPTFTGAMEPARAEQVYRDFIEHMRTAGVARVASGTFGAAMDIDLLNEGPVTIVVDSRIR